MNLSYWKEEWKQALLLTLAPLAVAAVFPRFRRERSHGALHRGFGLEPKPCLDFLPPGGVFGVAVDGCALTLRYTPAQEHTKGGVGPGFPLG